MSDEENEWILCQRRISDSGMAHDKIQYWSWFLANIMPTINVLLLSQGGNWI